MTDPLVTVVIPAYNAGKYLEQCLNSVLSQTYQNWEVWVVYSPSEDDTFSKLFWYLQYRNIHVRIVPKTNCATARNAGVEWARGKYIAFLDADDWWDRNKLEVIVGHLTSNRRYTYCSHFQAVHFPERTIYDKVMSGDSWLIGGVGTVVFRKGFLMHIQKKDGYIFNPSMRRADDIELMLRVREYPHGTVAAWLSHYRIHNEGLESNTSFIEKYLTLFQICFRNGEYFIGLYYVFNFSLDVFNRVFQCDIVKWKKETFK